MADYLVPVLTPSFNDCERLVRDPKNSLKDTLAYLHTSQPSFGGKISMFVFNKIQVQGGQTKAAPHHGFMTTKMDAEMLKEVSRWLHGEFSPFMDACALHECVLNERTAGVSILPSALREADWSGSGLLVVQRKNDIATGVMEDLAKRLFNA